INSAIQTVKDTVNSAVDSVVQIIADKIKAALQSTAKQAVTDSLTSALTSATGSLTETMSETFIDPLLNPIIQLARDNKPFQDVLTKMLAPFKSLLTKEMDKFIQEAVGDAVNRIAGSVSDAINAGVNTIEQALTNKIHSVIDPQILNVLAKLTQLSRQVTSRLDPIFAKLQAVAGIRFSNNFATMSGIQTSVTAIGLGNAPAFIGLPPATATGEADLADLFSLPADTSLDDWLTHLNQEGAIGLFVQNFNMGLGLFKPVVSNELPTFTAAKMNADAAGF